MVVNFADIPTTDIPTHKTMAAKTNGIVLPRRIHHKYDIEQGDASALRLVLALKPDWEESKEHIHFTRFTEGITNTVLEIRICSRRLGADNWRSC